MVTVLITGANRGIGLEQARLHAERGDEVLAVCRVSSGELRELRVEVHEGVEMSDGGSIGRLADALAHRPLDRVVANAGIRREDAFESLDFDAIREQLEVNALGPLRLVHAVRKALRPGAKVVLISTRMGSIGDNESGGEFGYRMSKAALNMAGVNLAHALRPRAVAVLLLHPGYVRTGLTGGAGLIDAREAAERLVALADRLTLADSGTFWHAEGKPLAW